MKHPNYRPRVVILAVMLQLSVAFVTGASVQIQIGNNFSGTDNSSSLITPADPNGAIGPKHFVQLINGAFAVYNKANGTRELLITDLQFWANAGVIISSDATISDPRIIYDPVSQRWFVSEIDFNKNASDPTIFANNFLIAVSDTSDPTRTWHGRSFIADPDSGYFADFPTLGVDSNAIYLSGDLFENASTPVGPALWSIPKADLLIDQTPAVVSNATWFGVLSYSDRGEILQPATCLDGSSAGKILAARSVLQPDDTFIASTILNEATPDATLLPPMPIKVGDYTYPIDAAQPDGTATLADNDARLSAKVITVGGIMYAVQNVQIGDHAAIRWYRINATNDLVIESGVITNADLDLIFPSIGVTANGVMVIACNGSGLTTRVSVFAFAGQTVNGTTTFGGPILLKAGTVSNYHDSLELLGEAPDSRWGDYSTTSLDPNDPSRFWTIQMLPLSSGTWVTHITEMLVIPQLAITMSDTNVNLSWPLFGAKYQLQAADGLSPTNSWSFIPQTPSTNGDQISVVLPASACQQFFRLVEQP